MAKTPDLSTAFLPTVRELSELIPDAVSLPETFRGIQVFFDRHSAFPQMGGAPETAPTPTHHGAENGCFLREKAALAHGS
jgi:hypothetical protein